MIPPQLIEKIKFSQSLVILTGAGVSAESGIPTFRDLVTGVWQNFDAQKLASADGFVADPALVWSFYEWCRDKVSKIEPNPAHHAIASLVSKIPNLSVITQNVDDLHERAGNNGVIHLHGRLNHSRCFRCNEPHADLENNAAKKSPLDRDQIIDPPHCRKCGGLIRPDVIWFGEALPQNEYNLSEVLCMEADLLLIIGTSGLVYPAANLPYLAKQAGARIAQINYEVNEFESIADFNLYGKAGKLLPLLCQLAFG